jgi:5-methylcytosine-specific restriction endonuclease McrA
MNASYEVVRLIAWQKAVVLLYTHKALAPGGYEDFYYLPTSDGTFQLPSAIVLKKYVRIPFYDIRPTRKNIFRRDRLICQYTGKQLNFREATIDHVIPTSRGGKNTWENMVTCEKSINSRKGDRSLADAQMTLISTPKAPSRAQLVIGAYPKMTDWHQFIPVK